MRIAALEPDSVFRSLGLKQGDLLLGINDQPIAAPEDIESLLQTIGSKGAATLFSGDACEPITSISSCSRQFLGVKESIGHKDR